MALWEEKFLLNLRDSTKTDSHGKRYKTAASGKGIRKGLAMVRGILKGNGIKIK